MRARDAAYAALFNIGLNAYAWKNTPARTKKLVLWDQVQAEQRPAFFQFEGGDEAYTWTDMGIPKRVLPARWFVYLAAGGTQQSPTTNAILDAFDAGMFSPLGKQTLSGTCEFARIVGPVLKEPGDLDGDGLLMIPISIILP